MFTECKLKLDIADLLNACKRNKWVVARVIYNYASIDGVTYHELKLQPTDVIRQILNNDNTTQQMFTIFLMTYTE
jgi:hypothetical protein